MILTRAAQVMVDFVPLLSIRNQLSQAVDQSGLEANPNLIYLIFL
jgi:hypothetical protein